MLTFTMKHFCYYPVLFQINSLVCGCFRGFSKTKRLNARGFVGEFLWSSMLHRTSKSLKRRGKSSGLHSKRNFFLGGAFFLWLTS